MDMQLILIIAAVSVGTYFLGKLGVKGDNRVEDRRRLAVRLAAWCSQNGLPGLGVLLSNYAVGDYSGVLHQFQALGDLLADADQSKAAVDAFLRVQLAKQLETAEGREALVAFIEKHLNVVIDRNSITQAPTGLAKKEV